MLNMHITLQAEPQPVLCTELVDGATKGHRDFLTSIGLLFSWTWNSIEIASRNKRCRKIALDSINPKSPLIMLKMSKTVCKIQLPAQDA